MGYLQFNVMKRDKLIEKYATQRGLKDFKVSWQRFNGPVAMNEALLSNSTDIVSGGVPGLITLWDKTQGTSFEVKGICALSSQPFLLNTANPDIKSIKDFSERDRIAVPSIKVSVQAVLLQMAAAAAYGEENYAKLDPLTVSMSPPDATIAMLERRRRRHLRPSACRRSSSSNWSRRTSTPCCRRSTCWGRTRFTVAWTSARFRKDNPELYGAFLDAVKEATAHHRGRSERHRAKLDQRFRLQAAARDGDQGRDRPGCRMDHDAGGDDEVRQIHAQGRHHQARAGVVEGHVLSGDRRLNGS